MRLPDDYDEHSGMSPVFITAIVAVTIFIAAIFIIVLISNSSSKGGGNTSSSVPQQVIITEESSEAVISGSKLRPDDLDFWDMYPEETTETEVEPSQSVTPETVEDDPSTDGKHTLVQYADGEEEWVLISPYLPKHGYDFTKLVCQSDIMKYYVDGKQMSYAGVDISKYDDYVDFVKLKKAGISFVMIRVGARGYGSGQLVLDEYFADNIKRASDAGLQIGVYFYSQAVTEDEAIEEANMVLENIRDYKVEYPVAYDMEFVANDDARIDTLSRAEKTSIAKAFLETIENAGYNPIIYGNKEWLIKEIDMSKLTAYDVWLSQIADVPDYPYKFTMWQYKDDAAVDGIAGYASLNISFVDYSEK
ncbi:MAG: glycoside hydrolase family 25 protein [Lachnospiraceae bacterium]|nr:glycoside hydrolase family 25 protein [Lachnospiraceae bacterium]